MRKIIEIYEGASYNRFMPSKRDILKMREYYAKGSNPKQLANTVKDKDKALARYHIAVADKWYGCEKAFYDRCIELGVDKEYLETVRKKALADIEGYLSGITPPKSVKKEIKPIKVSTPSGNKPEPQKKLDTRKTIEADTGFIIKGNKNNTPFS